MHSYPKRLIEVDLPIKQISAHARKEKSTRHGHISTLHIWWARRPLAACRAVICAALWPDPVDPLCPPRFREDACRLINAFAAKAATDKTLAAHCSPETWKKWQALAKSEGGLDFHREPHWNVLRFALLDFIADFANWDNSTVREYLETSRALTHSAHEAMGGTPGTRPLVMDPFAGGGSIPLEALRVGADAFASDLNPVPVLLNKVVLEYIPKYGPRLGDEVRKWGEWMKHEAKQQLAEFYPQEPDGATHIAYLWARTVQCEGPGCGAQIPLIRSMQITRDGHRWHYSWKLSGKDIAVQVGKGQTSTSKPSVAGGSATCPRSECGYTTSAKSVRTQLQQKNGGAKDARLLSVYIQSDDGRYFRDPTAADITAAHSASNAFSDDDFPQEEINPIRPYKNTRGLSAVTRIGMTRFGHLYTNRQGLAIRCFQRVLLSMPDEGDEPELRTAVMSVLNCAISRFVFQNCSLSRWHIGRSTIEGAFGKQALQVVWDFAESNPIGSGSANWDGAVEWIMKVIAANSVLDHPGTVARARAQDQLLPDDSAHALITDPPYFAAIPYSDLSNVFYVWERDFLKAIHPDLYCNGLVAQADEIIVTNANAAIDGTTKSPGFYKAEMIKALQSARGAMVPSGIGIVVFADSSTASWEAILGSIIDAGWSVTGSWPIDTELQNRTQAASSASLQSSIHIVCRPREESSGLLTADLVGDWRDVLRELPTRIHQWMPRLAAEGVVGADAIFACLGPALEIFSRYGRVEKASGDAVTLGEYLEQVWAAVAKEALTMIFTGADTSGFEEDARLTAMWLWTLNAGNNDATNGESVDEEESDDSEGGAKKAKTGGFVLEYDAARKIAQGLGAHLEDLGSLVEVSGDEARLLPVEERARHLFGKDEGNVAAAKKKKKIPQLDLFQVLEEVDGQETISGEAIIERHGKTVLDRIHQSMILFAAGRSEALKRFLVEEGVGRDQRFWSLAQALSALYPTQTSEKRWIDGVLARKKGLGF